MFSIFLYKKYNKDINYLQNKNFRNYLLTSQMNSINKLINKNKELYNLNLLYPNLLELKNPNSNYNNNLFIILAFASSMGFFMFYRYKK